MFKNMKVILVLVAILVLAVVVYAFAAANTVPATKAGDGSGAITGYTVSNIVYNLNGTDPSTLDSVAFDLSAPAVQAQVQLVTGGTWYSCTISGGTAVTCNTAGLTVSSIDQLRVVATSN